MYEYICIIGIRNRLSNQGILNFEVRFNEKYSTLKKTLVKSLVPEHTDAIKPEQF